MIDFSNCDIDLSVNYNGANGKKACIIYNNERYMIKTAGLAKDNPNIKYSNSCISEYVSCNIIDEFGYEVQKTILGEFNGKMVVACKDFRENGKYTFYDFASLKNNIIFSSTNGTDAELSEVLTTIEEQNLIQVEKLKTFFWDQFIIDTFLGNFDRHNGNWGYLYNNETGLCKPAPIFDCGSCLYPQLAEDQMKIVLRDVEQINERIYVFPNSALKIGGTKLNYYNYLKNTDNVDCYNALKKFVERYDKDKILQVINDAPIISDIHKEFIYTMLNNRLEKIIVYSLENNINISKDKGSLSILKQIKEYKKDVNVVKSIKKHNNDLEL